VHTGTLGAIGSNSHPLTIGRAYEWGPWTYAFRGYIDEVRVVNGTAMYTASFTPTGPFTAGDTFDVSLLYKNASGTFVSIGAGLGDVGTVDQVSDSKTAYWDDPNADRPGVEVTDEVVRVSADPDAGNSSDYTLEVISAEQLTTGDSTGEQGDVKVVYAFTELIGPGLLLHCDGSDGSTTFIDSSSNGYTVTAVGNAQIDTAQKQFGTGSALFDGVGDSLTVPASDEWVFGTGDFTVELWYRPTVATGSQEYIGTGDNAGAPAQSWVFVRQNAGFLRFIINPGQYAGGSWTGTPGTWHHLAASRQGTSLRVFVDGTQLGGTGTVSNPANANSTLYVGGKINYVNGHIDEVRIVKGEALYTANFTPPTAPY